MFAPAAIAELPATLRALPDALLPLLVARQIPADVAIEVVAELLHTPDVLERIEQGESYIVANRGGLLGDLHTEAAARQAYRDSLANPLTKACPTIIDLHPCIGFCRLAEIVEAWPTLPAEARDNIVALVKSFEADA